MSGLETVIGAFLVLLPFVTSAVARSKGRSPLAWGLLSLVLTPFGSLLLLLMLPEQDRGKARKPNGQSGMLGSRPGAFVSIAFGDRAEAARNVELDDRLASHARDARVDQLIAERLQALRAPPALNTAPTAVTIKPAFGKRR